MAEAKQAQNTVRHFSMVRSFHLADVFTIANGSCGVSAIFEAMRTESIRLELWHPTGAAPGTVVRPRTEEAFVSAIATCL